MAKKRVFVSFDYENDRHYKFLLEAWDANKNFDFLFADRTPREIDSWNVSRIKAALTTKVRSATYTLVLVGKEANKFHKDYKLIGYRNWINFEVAKSKENGNRLVGVKLNRNYESPEELKNAGAKWAWSFSEWSIVNALNQASNSLR